jgi:hypothetical protein
MPQVLDGQLVTKVRHLKEGQAIGRVVLSTNWLRSAKGGITRPGDPRPVELDMAECLACGGQVVTATWSLRPGNKRDGSALFEQPPFHQALKRYLGFAREHEDLYIASEPCANVWVYHSTWSLAFDLPGAYNSLLGFEQALLGRIAYRVAKQAHLEGLGPRDVLIVPNQRCLSDAECDSLRALAARGGGLILTGDVAACDENYRERDEPALAGLYKHPRVRYFASCPGKTSQPTAASGSLRPSMPRRAAEILRAVRELARKGLAAELDPGGTAQPLTYLDVYRQPAGAIAHVVHYGDGQPNDLRLRLAAWLPQAGPVLYSPYLPSPLPLAPAADGWVKLPCSMGRYAAVRFV